MRPPRPLGEKGIDWYGLSSVTCRIFHGCDIQQDCAPVPCNVAANVFDEKLRELDDDGNFVHRAGRKWILENPDSAATYWIWAVICAVFNPAGVLHVMHELDPEGYKKGELCPKPAQLDAFVDKLGEYYKFVSRFTSRVFEKSFRSFGAVRAFLWALRDHGKEWLMEAAKKKTRDESLHSLRRRLRYAINGVKDLTPFQVHSIVRLFETLVHEPFGPCTGTVPHGSGGEQGFLLLTKILRVDESLSLPKQALACQEMLVDALNAWARKAWDGEFADEGITKENAKFLFLSWGLEFEPKRRMLRHILGIGKFLDVSDVEHLACVLNKLLKNTRPANISETKQADATYSWPIFLPEDAILPELEWAKPYIVWHEKCMAAYRKLVELDLLRPLPDDFRLPGADKRADVNARLQVLPTLGERLQR